METVIIYFIFIVLLIISFVYNDSKEMKFSILSSKGKRLRMTNCILRQFEGKYNIYSEKAKSFLHSKENDLPNAIFQNYGDAYNFACAVVIYCNYTWDYKYNFDDINLAKQIIININKYSCPDQTLIEMANKMLERKR